MTRQDTALRHREPACTASYRSEVIPPVQIGPLHQRDRRQRIERSLRGELDVPRLVIEVKTVGVVLRPIGAAVARDEHVLGQCEVRSIPQRDLHPKHHGERIRCSIDSRWIPTEEALSILNLQSSGGCRRNGGYGSANDLRRQQSE